MEISPLQKTIPLFVLWYGSLYLSIILAFAHENSHGGPPEVYSLSLLVHSFYAVNTQDAAIPFWLR